MAISKQSDDSQSEEGKVYSESGGSDPEYDPNSEPSYGILGETHAKFFNLSIEKKKLKARFVSHPVYYPLFFDGYFEIMI